MTAPLPPGSVLGVVGGGQLGMMFVEAAHALGYRVHVFEQSPASPAGAIADHETVGPFSDGDAVARFASGVAALTLEVETVPWTSLAAAERVTRVHPASAVVRWVQDRLAQRRHLDSLGIPVVPFAAIEHESDIPAAVAHTGLPAVMKVSRSGYDGRGQARLKPGDDVAAAWRDLGSQPCVLERFMHFEREFSLIIARGADGRSAVFPPVANEHVDGILDVSSVPSGIPAAAVERGEAIVRRAAEGSGLVGLLCAELYLMPGDHVVVNEVCARPHNSGHLTIEACESSQFEQLVRVLAGQPLGGVALTSAAAMANLVGVDLASRGPEPAGVFVHDYRKAARPGRKVGHVTALGATAAEARTAVIRAREAIEGRDL